MKRIIIGLLAITLSLSATACGSNTSSSSEGTVETTKSADGLTEKDKEDIQKARDELSDKDKKELDEIAKELEGGTPSDNKAEEPAVEEVKYAPKQEILDADFDSGLVQIGDDIFKCGGYLTLGDFVQQYGDNWEWEKNGQTEEEYANIDEYLNECADKYDYVGNSNLCFKNKNDPELFISVMFIPYKEHVYFGHYDNENVVFTTSLYNENNKISDFIVYATFPSGGSKSYTYYPKGISFLNPVETTGKDVTFNEKVKEFYNENFGVSRLSDKTDYSDFRKDKAVDEGFITNFSYDVVNKDTTNEDKAEMIDSAYKDKPYYSDFTINYSFDYTNPFKLYEDGAITSLTLSNIDFKEFFVPMELKEENLLGFKPSIAYTITVNNSYAKSFFSYDSFQLTKTDDYKFYTGVVKNDEPLNVNSSGNIIVLSDSNRLR